MKSDFYCVLDSWVYDFALGVSLTSLALVFIDGEPFTVMIGERTTIVLIGTLVYGDEFKQHILFLFKLLSLLTFLVKIDHFSYL
jgi:hypothetical protein